MKDYLFTVRELSKKTGYGMGVIYRKIKIGEIKAQKVRTGIRKYYKWRISLEEADRINKILKR